MVVVGTGHGVVARVDPATGTDRWQTAVTDIETSPSPAAACSRSASTTCSRSTPTPAISRFAGHAATRTGRRLPADARLLAGSDRLTALDPADGLSVAEVALQAIDEPVGDGDLLVVPITEGLVLLDARSGKERYRLTDGGRYGSPLLADGRLLALRD